MTTEEMIRLMDLVHEELAKLSSTKGQEYANDEDRLANFKRLGLRLGLSPEKVLLVYLTKHMDAIEHYVRTGTTLSEPISERINDAILYLCLLRGLSMERQIGRVTS